MDRYIDGDNPHFDECDAFERVMWSVFWSEHDYGEDFDYEAFEDAVFTAIDDSVWERADDDVREAWSDAKARRDMWRYNGVNQRDYYGT